MSFLHNKQTYCKQEIPSDTEIVFRIESLEGKCNYVKFNMYEDMSDFVKKIKKTHSMHEILQPWRRFHYDLELEKAIPIEDFRKLISKIISETSIIVNELLGKCGFIHNVKDDWVVYGMCNESKMSAHCWLANDYGFFHKDIREIAIHVAKKLNCFGLMDLGVYSSTHGMRFKGFDKIKDGKFSKRVKNLFDGFDNLAANDKFAEFISIYDKKVTLPKINVISNKVEYQKLDKKTITGLVKAILHNYNDKDNYWKWMQVGILTRSLGKDGWDIFDNWSKNGKKYNKEKNYSIWRGLKKDKDFSDETHILWKMFNKLPKEEQENLSNTYKLEKLAHIEHQQRYLNNLTPIKIFLRSLLNVKCKKIQLNEKTIENRTDILKEIRKHKASLIKSQCGTGKTKLIMKIIENDEQRIKNENQALEAELILKEQERCKKAILEAPLEMLKTRKKIEKIKLFDDLSKEELSEIKSLNKNISRILQTLNSRAIDTRDPFKNQTKILFITHRIALGRQIHEKLKNFRFNFYLDHKTKNKFPSEITDRFIVQMESLHKLPPKSYDYIILDESENICSQLHANTLQKPQFTFNLFSGLLKAAKHIISMDANLTAERSVKMLKICAGITEESILLVENDYKPYKGHVVDFVNSFGELTAELIADLKSNKKIVFASNIRENALLLETEVIENRILKTEEICVIVSEHNYRKNDEEFKRLMADYHKVKLFIYSPSVDSGLSFEEHHFDRFYGYFSNNSSNTQSINQMMHRVRNFKDKTYTICCGSGFGGILPKKISEIRRELAMNMKELDNDILSPYIEFDDSIIPHVNLTFPIVKFILNERKFSNIDKSYYDRRFMDLLVNNGFSVGCIFNAKTISLKETSQTLKELNLEAIKSHINMETLEKIANDDKDDKFSARLAFISNVYGIDLKHLVENIDKIPIDSFLKDFCSEKKLKTYDKACKLLDDKMFIAGLREKEKIRLNEQMLRHDDVFFKAKLGKFIVDELGKNPIKNAEMNVKVDKLFKQLESILPQIHANFRKLKNHASFANTTFRGKMLIMKSLLGYYGFTYAKVNKKMDANYAINFKRVCLENYNMQKRTGNYKYKSKNGHVVAVEALDINEMD